MAKKSKNRTRTATAANGGMTRVDLIRKCRIARPKKHPTRPKCNWPARRLLKFINKEYPKNDVELRDIHAVDWSQAHESTPAPKSRSVGKTTAQAASGSTPVRSPRRRRTPFSRFDFNAMSLDKANSLLVRLKSQKSPSAKAGLVQQLMKELEKHRGLLSQWAQSTTIADLMHSQ
jgi:hypothetical protein